MTRSYQIYGESMVRVNFGKHIPFTQISGTNPIVGAGVSGAIFDLGLTQDPIRIIFDFSHTDVHIDDYGVAVPVDTLFMLASATIEAKLVHWDANVMELCLREATAGGGFPTELQPAGTLAAAGTPMGIPSAATVDEVFFPASGYHYTSLNIIPGRPGSLPWRFPSSYLTGPPVILPLGTDRSIAECRWRVIPFGFASQFEITISGGAPASGSHSTTKGITLNVVDTRIPNTPFLWDHTAD